LGRVITLVSGKGGVGKTSITANLGIALAKRGISVLLIDADVAMANLSLMLGMHSSPISLHDVLLGEADVEDAIYDGPAGVKFIPSGLSLEGYRRVDSERLQSIVNSLQKQYDFILLDAPAGIEKNVASAIAAADEALLVTMPNTLSLTDAIKIKLLAERLDVKPLGIIVNFIMGEKGELRDYEISKLLDELPIYGLVPYDDEMRRSFMQKTPHPVVLRKPSSKSAVAIQQLAAKLSGTPISIGSRKKERQILGAAKPKQGIFARIIGMFKKGKG